MELVEDEEGTSPRRNPFMEEDEPVVEMEPWEEELTEEQQEEADFRAAAKFYTAAPFYSHRPGPVYTIPEDEEEEEHWRHGRRLTELTSSDEEDAYVAAVTGLPHSSFAAKQLPVTPPFHSLNTPSSPCPLLR